MHSKVAILRENVSGIAAGFFYALAEDRRR